MKHWRERSPRRALVFDFVQAEVRAGRPFPSSTAIAQHMGWNRPASAVDALHALVRWEALAKRYEGKALVFYIPEESPPPEQRDIF